MSEFSLMSHPSSGSLSSVPASPVSPMVTVISRLPYEHALETGSQRPLILVAALGKKLFARPMQEVLSRLAAHVHIQVAALDERILLEEPFEAWPICACLLAVYSSGFPLRKVQQYIELRKPFVINDLYMQEHLLDRRETYRVMEESGIPVPPHVTLDRGSGPVDVIEEEDAIIINGQRLEKPFVMKPVSHDDHDIYVFFRSHDGGGAQHLFRKRKERCSEFLPNCHNIPKEGSFIFEKFIHTGGTDIKVYTVGPNYAHAEGRKAPVVDGKVLRDADGKELRCPILLNAFEKDLARRVVEAFGQNICGFDLLRTQDNKSYVCDVNGWSFVKRSPPYYNDCARILYDMVMEALGTPSAPTSPVLPDELMHPHDVNVKGPHDIASKQPVLRCVIGLIRHGDRTPKEKLKIKVQLPEFLDLFAAYGKVDKSTGHYKEIKLKSRLQLEDVLARTRRVLQRADIDDGLRSKMQQMESVLTRSPISGINRKFQLKPTKRTAQIDGMKPAVSEAQIVMKWGGELTNSGLSLATKTGESFRENLYTSRDDDTGLLRLHSTYRHDLKLYSSEEGRVQITAAAFAKGLLKLDGEITPILVSLVRKDDAVNELLDNTEPAREEMDKAKQVLHQQLQNAPDADVAKAVLCPEAGRSRAVEKALDTLGRPIDAVKELYRQLKMLAEELQRRVSSAPQHVFYQNETPLLLLERWRKLVRDLYDAKKDKYDLSKIPDIYDSIKYHVSHNNSFRIPQAKQVFLLSKALADVVVPSEYGLTTSQKVGIANDIAGSLKRKILHDLRVAAGLHDKYANFHGEVSHKLDRRHSSVIKVKTPNRNVRTRLYFTSESHIHALLTLIRYGASGTPPIPCEGEDLLSAVSELNYLTHIVCRLFERPDEPPTSSRRFYVEWMMSPGRVVPDPADQGRPREEVEPLRTVYSDMTLEQVAQLFDLPV